MGERIIFVGDKQRPSRVELDPSAVDNSGFDEFFAYWRSKRGDAIVPQYDEFDPKDLRRQLGFIVIMEALRGYADFRYRLVGSKVTRYFLTDTTGKTIREAFGGVLAEFLVAINRHACEKSVPVRLSGPTAIIGNTFFPRYDSLYLPWASGNSTDKVVSLFLFDDKSLGQRDVWTAADPPPDSVLVVPSADDLVRERPGEPRAGAF
jgi:hypothetical protein